MAECERAGARGRETQSCPHTGLFMTGDVAEAHPLSPASGEESRQAEREIDRGEVRVASHQRRALPDLWFLMTRGDQVARYWRHR